MENNKKISFKKMIGNLFMLIFIIIFVSSFSKIFGSGNTLVGVCIITATLMFMAMDVKIKFKDAIYAIIVGFVSMGISSYVSMINPY